MSRIRLTVRKRLILLTVFFVLIPCMVIGVVSYELARGEIKKQFMQAMEHQGQAIITDPFVSATSGNMAISVAQALPDHPGPSDLGGGQQAK